MSAEALIVPLQTLTAKARSALACGAPHASGEADAILGHLQELLERRLTQIRQQTALHQAQQQAWLDQQRQEQTKMAEAEALIQILHQTQQRLHIAQASAIPFSDSHATVAETAPLPWRTDRNLLLLEELHAALAGLPPHLLGNDMPFVRLLRQVERWRRPSISAHALLPEELTAFQAMLERTLHQFLESQKTIHAHHVEMQNRLLSILPELLALARLDDLPEKMARTFNDLTEHLRATLEGYPIPACVVEEIEKSLASSRKELDLLLVSRSVGEGVADALNRYLDSMGYETILPICFNFATGYGEGEFRIPGGERLFALIHPDGKIGFQLRHECGENSRLPLTESAWTLFQQQEQLWCKDLLRLTQQLVENGYDCAISFQRGAHPDRIPLVVVERPVDILSASGSQRPNLRTMSLPS